MKIRGNESGQSTYTVKPFLVRFASTCFQFLKREENVAAICSLRLFLREPQISMLSISGAKRRQYFPPSRISILLTSTWNVTVVLLVRTTSSSGYTTQRHPPPKSALYTKSSQLAANLFLIVRGLQLIKIVRIISTVMIAFCIMQFALSTYTESASASISRNSLQA